MNHFFRFSIGTCSTKFISLSQDIKNFAVYYLDTFEVLFAKKLSHCLLSVTTLQLKFYEEVSTVKS